jgi:AbrB family looped-hinge helix DNA binding protein
MSRVTSKLQVTIPKRVAEACGVRPGSEVVFEPAGDVIRLRVAGDGRRGEAVVVARRLAAFDAAISRQRERDKKRPPEQEGRGRGWTPDELYDRRPLRD